MRYITRNKIINIKIIKLSQDQVVATKIIKKAECDTLLSVEDKYRKIQAKCDSMLNKTKEQITKIKEDIYQQEIKNISAQQLETWQLCEGKINQFFANIKERVGLLVYKLLTKVGMFNISIDNIKALLDNECDDVSATYILIQANSTLLNELQNKYLSHKNIHFKLNDSLAAHECIFETSLFVFRFNIDHTIEQINHLLQVKGDRVLKLISLEPEINSSGEFNETTNSTIN